MLDALKRKLGATTEESVSLSDYNTLQTEFASFKTDANALLETADAAHAETKQALEQALAQIEELKQFADVVVAEKAVAAEKAEALCLAARQEKITAAVGDARAPALMAATSSMDDIAFDAIVSALKVTGEAEAESALFKEVGAAAEVDAAKIVETNGTLRLLKQEFCVE